MLAVTRAASVIRQTAALRRMTMSMSTVNKQEVVVAARGELNESDSDIDMITILHHRSMLWA
jgi:hypothetical protein